jgi:hypothetical protein
VSHQRPFSLNACSDLSVRASRGAPNDWRRPCGLPKAWGSTMTDQSDKLPTYSDPSFVSGRLGHQRHHWNRLRTSPGQNPKIPGSLQINLLFTIFAQQAALHRSDANFIFFRRHFVLTRRRRSAGAPNDWRRALRCMAAILELENDFIQ